MALRRFELSEGSSNKFWAIDWKGSSVTVRFGRIGTEGQTKTKDLGTPAAASAEADRLVREKLGKGYREQGAKAAKTAPAAKKAKGGVATTPAKSVATKLNKRATAKPKKSAAITDDADDEARQHVVAKIAEHGLEKRRVEIEALLRPAVWLRTIRAARSRTRIGGRPSLPHGTSWPHHDVRPLSFVGSIVLSEMPLAHAGSDLPREGALLFFILDTYLEGNTKQLDTYAQEGRVVYVSERELAAAKPVPPPSPSSGRLMRDGEPAEPIFPERGVASELAWTLPASSNPIVDKLRLSKKEIALYDQLWADVFGESDRHRHQLLGHREREYDRSNKATTRVLFQFRSDPNCGMSWGAQVDDLCFLIPEADLRARRWTAAFPYLGD